MRASFKTSKFSQENTYVGESETRLFCDFSNRICSNIPWKVNGKEMSKTLLKNSS